MFVIHNPKTHKFWNRDKKTVVFPSREDAAQYAKAKNLDFCILEFKGIASDGLPIWGIEFADWIFLR